MTSRLLVGLAIAGFTAAAGAQSAGVVVSAGSATVAPGGTITVTVEADYDTAGAGGGLFGDAGFYGFGGDVFASGDAAGDVSGSVPTLNSMLTFGETASAGTAPSVARAAAGRGFDGGLPDDPATMMTFAVTASAGAVAGETFGLTFDGAVVLVLNSELATFATNPGLNQNLLTSNTLTITIGAGGCNDADLAEPFGILDLNDISTFVAAFTTMDPVADIDDSGVFDLTDISLFVGAFTAGCP